MKRVLANLWWALLALAGAWAYATLALHRGEPLSSAYILIAALCSYAIGYRFYSKWLAASVLALDDRRATPCEVHDDGKDFVKTNKWNPGLTPDRNQRRCTPVVHNVESG